MLSCLIDGAQLNPHTRCYESVKHLSASDASSPSSSICEAKRTLFRNTWAVSTAATVTYGALWMLFRESLIYMLATLARLGVGSEAVIPILGYRLFNFWLPMPLAVVFYPTLGWLDETASRRLALRWQLRTEAGYARHGGQKKPCRVR